MLHTDTRIQQSQVVVDLRDGSHGGTWVARCGFLINGNCRAETFDDINVWLIHLTKKLTRICGKAFDIATLAFGINGVKGKRALTASRKTCKNDELVTRKLETDVLQIVFACTADDDFLSHVLRLPIGHLASRSSRRKSLISSLRRAAYSNFKSLAASFISSSRVWISLCSSCCGSDLISALTLSRSRFRR